ncbi:hypothetical protein, partial [Staphylococcus capitis]|uniref:hypothetical protein n=1 Tax=Staphylococcus capitis TaxID=29388 RepID=UPI003D07CE10
MTSRIDTAQLQRANAFVTRVLGPYVINADMSWPHGESRVLEVYDRDGLPWIVKTCRLPLHFEQESHAYREWVPAIGGRTPRLVDADPDSNTLIMTREPGCITPGSPAEVHRQAGALISRMHRSAPAQPAADFTERLRDRLSRGLGDAAALFDARDLDFVHDQITALSGGPVVQLVPAHQDNQPRNW